jgi:5-methyltetrahydropteroyltriglutamate--homocysteine methyltransferase
MRGSTDRLLSTHAGSLPRPDVLVEMMRARQTNRPVDDAAVTREVESAVDAVVKRQVDIGLDVVDDGEMSKPSFQSYIAQRIEGTEMTDEPVGNPWAGSREDRAFHAYYEWEAAHTDNPARASTRIHCTGPVKYIGHDLVQADIARLKAAMAKYGAGEAFIPAISPSNIENWIKNRYYATDEDYLMALADALHEEYTAITDAGLLLQIDDPRLVTYYIMRPELSVDEVRKWAITRVEALNHALRGIPPEMVRFHTCYSVNMGPRVHDMELKDIVDIILMVNAQAFSFEAANPRHEHEWEVWKDVDLADDRILIPGVITQSSVLVEHPKLIAQRLGRFASVVGKERVIAGADCGFGTFAGHMEIHPTVAWAKLEALVQGTRMASEELW